MWASPAAATHCYPLPRSTRNPGGPSKWRVESKSRRTSEQEEQVRKKLLPNVLRRRRVGSWHGFSLGVDLGDSRTGLAFGRGLVDPVPLTVLELKGQSLELRLLEIARHREADEFIVGLPLSLDGKETPRSNKVRSIAGRFAALAAERGWRVYLQDENGTTEEALESMINLGVRKLARREKIDAYSAKIILQRYFSSSGSKVELVLPKQLDLQERLLESYSNNVGLSDDDDIY